MEVKIDEKSMKNEGRTKKHEQIVEKSSKGTHGDHSRWNRGDPGPPGRRPLAMIYKD